MWEINFRRISERLRLFPVDFALFYSFPLTKVVETSRVRVHCDGKIQAVSAVVVVFP